MKTSIIQKIVITIITVSTMFFAIIVKAGTLPPSPNGSPRFIIQNNTSSSVSYNGYAGNGGFVQGTQSANSTSQMINIAGNGTGTVYIGIPGAGQCEFYCSSYPIKIQMIHAGDGSQGFVCSPGSSYTVTVDPAQTKSK